VSPQTKEEIKEYHRKYRERPEVQEYAWQFNHSEKGRASRQKYYYSEKGKRFLQAYSKRPEVRERHRLQSKKTRASHPPKCDCAACQHKRDHNRELMRNHYREHSLVTCNCEKCNVRRQTRLKNYPAKKENATERRRRFKQQILTLLGGKCASCGFIPRHSCQIDIHERNGPIGKKADWETYKQRYNPAILMGTKKGRKLLIRYLRELVPLCRNCHIGLTCKVCRSEVEETIKDWRMPDVKC
jgi:hypothetical protein